MIRISRGWGINGRPRGSGGHSARSQEAEFLFGSLAETSFLISDGNVALEKKRGSAHTAPPRMADMRLSLMPLF